MIKLMILFVVAVLTLSSSAFAQCGKSKKMAEKANHNSHVQPPGKTVKSKPVIAKPGKDSVIKMDSKSAAMGPVNTPAMAMKSKPKSATVNNGKTQVVKKDMAVSHSTKAVKHEKSVKKNDDVVCCQSGAMDKMAICKAK
ncbi:hypothetical protein FC093_17110 [Ilyomonas limi]|uniref:Uncharacterized protein n=1 Tax=Ilyomonas limi TaxID=2575867 RepID=A0A4U3KXA1_9BACT|nr:hypothetical protein [Ilyomonas limi]TKK66304.1 hypothetical protein FC093_17110 [Ilyomonas limi]